MVNTRLRMILVARLRYLLSLLYIVFLGVIYCREYVGTSVWQRTIYWEYCQCMGQYHIAHINKAPPRPNYWVCPGIHLSRLVLVCDMTWPSRSYTSSSCHTFRSSFGRTYKNQIWSIHHSGGEVHSNPLSRLFVSGVSACDSPVDVLAQRLRASHG